MTAELLASDSSSPSAPSTPSGETESKIIGYTEFEADDEVLDTYLTDVLDWWMGRRPPRGVELAQTRRCL